MYMHTYIYIHIYLNAPRITPGQIEAVVFCGYVVLRNILAQVLIWHSPEHEVEPSGGLWGAEAAPGARWGLSGALEFLGRPFAAIRKSLGSLIASMYFFYEVFWLRCCFGNCQNTS